MNIVRFALWNFHTIAESLPISSSGHMMLLSKLIKRVCPSFAKGEISEQEERLMHLPTLGILTIFLGIYFPLWANISLPKALFTWAFPLYIANGITALLYFLIPRKKRSFFPLPLGFLITGMTLFALTLLPRGTVTELSFLKASLIGIAQGCALLPGISRLAFTYTTGVALGLEPHYSMLFSLGAEWFLIVAALIKTGHSFIKQSYKESSRAVFNRYMSLSTVTFFFFQLFILGCSSFIAYYALVFATGLCIAQETLLFSLYMTIPTLVAVFLEKEHPFFPLLHIKVAYDKNSTRSLLSSKKYNYFL